MMTFISNVLATHSLVLALIALSGLQTIWIAMVHAAPISISESRALAGYGTQTSSNPIPPPHQKLYPPLQDEPQLHYRLQLPLARDIYIYDDDCRAHGDSCRTALAHVQAVDQSAPSASNRVRVTLIREGEQEKGQQVDSEEEEEEDVRPSAMSSGTDVARAERPVPVLYAEWYRTHSPMDLGDADAP
ncbi:hypothetical protein CVT24_003759 [Panaeolus cyanescens]|uniref:Uncharacterized protein n=1 Tax=Panaeolus cyanescens TaxID=181874 RepID=A0A409YYH5_9AGAR|nr:hypothetical protein CVT24_003759 [Panaeolus cyanescens]